MSEANSDQTGTLAERLWKRDASLWKSDPKVQAKILDRMGWLDVVGEMQNGLDDLEAFAEEVRRDGFTHAVLLGMGGSSLAPDVFRNTFGSAAGHPQLHVLDTTDSTAILAVERQLEMDRALFIVSSKSGTTTETLSLYRYFWEKVQAVRGAETGRSFIAITDPDSWLSREGLEQGFRRVFENRADIGGRYSALSYFGLVPAAVIGVDVRALLDRAQSMVEECGPAASGDDNSCISLGIAMGNAAQSGRDKLTLVLSPEIATFGYWVEQLIAESTGKEGKGILPVEGEPLGDPSVYGSDRLFVHMDLGSSEDQRLQQQLRVLAGAGHPVIHLELKDKLDLGGEFFRWEVATAVAGSVLGINPFDEPNVQESKDNTSRLLKEYEEQGRLPEPQPDLGAWHLALYGCTGDSVNEAVGSFLSQAQPGDYVAFMAYVPPDQQTGQLLQNIRVRARDELKAATTLGYGPRFLHSTGQLHKGGPPSGLFVQITTNDPQDLEIPGAPYSFNTLKRAQALGDFEALGRHGLRVIRIHIAGDLSEGLRAVGNAVTEGLSARTV